MFIEKINNQGSRSVNLIPLINVIFLLLIFFLVTGTIDHGEESLILPKSLNNYDEMTDGTIITVNKYGEIFLYDEMISFNDFERVIRDRVAIGDKTRFVIKIDQNLPGFYLFNILKIMEARGIENIDLVTEGVVR